MNAVTKTTFIALAFKNVHDRDQGLTLYVKPTYTITAKSVPLFNGN